MAQSHYLIKLRSFEIGRPQNVIAFFGLASYYRRFVQGFATIAEPPTRLTKKHVHFHWTEEAQRTFDRLKQGIINATSLAYPYPDWPCIIDTDASDVGLGAAISESIDGIERPIAFFSRVMNQAQIIVLHDESRSPLFRHSNIFDTSCWATRSSGAQIATRLSG